MTLQQTHTHPVAWDGFDCTTAKQTPLVLSGRAVRRFELLYNSKANTTRVVWEGCQTFRVTIQQQSKHHSCCLGGLSDVSSYYTTAKQTPLVLSGRAVRRFELLYNSKANTTRVVWEGCQTFRVTIQQQSKHHSCCLGGLSDVSSYYTTAKQTPLVLSGRAVRRFELLYNNKHTGLACCLRWFLEVSSDCGKVTQASVIASDGCQKL